MALNIGQIGENLALGSATIVKAEEGEAICGLCHPRFLLHLFKQSEFQITPWSVVLLHLSNPNLNAIFTVREPVEMCNMADMLHFSL